MKNQILEHVKSTVTLKVVGKRPDNFIRKLIQNQIELLKVKEVSRHVIYIKIYQKDVEFALSLKTIYDVTIASIHGLSKVKKMVKSYQILLLCMVLGLLVLYLLSFMIFDIEVVHTNKDVRNLLTSELEEHGIVKKHFKKSYKKIQKIKADIVEENKDKIEWLEIENIGTKYIVRVEMRKRKEEEKKPDTRDLVAKKAAVIKQIESKSGVAVKKVNDYVEKGETILSGSIYLNEEIKDMVASEGTVYGEVWYNVHISYPFAYYEERETGKKNTVYTVTFLNKRWELFNREPYQDKKIKKKSLLDHPVLPLAFQKEEQKEVVKIEQILTEEEAVLQAAEAARNKIKKNLREKEHIIDEKKLKVETKDSRIELDMFFTVYENITEYKKIEMPVVPEEEKRG